MEVAKQSWGFVCVGTNFNSDICREHEHYLGEGYVNTKSTDFWEGFDSEGDANFNSFFSLHVIIRLAILQLGVWTGFFFQ